MASQHIKNPAAMTRTLAADFPILPESAPLVSPATSSQCESLVHSTGDASPPAALILPQILPVCSVVAPPAGASPVSVPRQTFTTGAEA